MNSKTPEKRIKDAIGDVTVAQLIIDLANKEGANLNDIAALLEETIDASQIIQWLQDRINLHSVAILLGQGIESPVITQLINKQVDLGDVATNAQILLNGGIRAGLINKWLKNKTHLSSAIVIMHQGVDLNLIGTSSKGGDFTSLTGATPNKVLSRIPADVKIERWIPHPGKAQKGMKFMWRDASGTWRLRMHDLDPSAPGGSNAASGWVLRIQHGHYFMDAAGNFYKDTTLDPGSEKYNEANANATHIPIQQP